MDKEDEIKVVVCDSCLTACCWQGLFYCDKYREAGIVSKTVGELKTLDLENPCYWDQGQKLESTPS